MQACRNAPNIFPVRWPGNTGNSVHIVPRETRAAKDEDVGHIVPPAVGRVLAGTRETPSGDPLHMLSRSCLSSLDRSRSSTLTSYWPKFNFFFFYGVRWVWGGTGGSRWAFDFYFGVSSFISWQAWQRGTLQQMIFVAHNLSFCYTDLWSVATHQWEAKKGGGKAYLSAVSVHTPPSLPFSPKK